MTPIRDITVDTLLASEFVTGPRFRINQSVTDETTDSQIFTSNATGDDQASIALNIASGKSTGTVASRYYQFQTI